MCEAWREFKISAAEEQKWVANSWLFKAHKVKPLRAATGFLIRRDYLQSVE
jgi:hypothetical protein